MLDHASVSTCRFRVSKLLYGESENIYIKTMVTWSFNILLGECAEDTEPQLEDTE